MRAAVHPDFVLEESSLRDRYLGTHYSLSPDAVWLVRRMQTEGRLDQLVRRIGREHRLAAADAQQALLGFYAQLAGMGGLIVRWPGLGLRLRHWLTWPKRYRATLPGLMRGCLRAYALLVPPAAIMSWVLPTLCVPMFIAIASCAVHECGHAAAVRWLKRRAVILSRPAYMAVAYVPPDSRRQQIVIALAGPVAAAASIAAVFGLVRSPLLIAVAGIHLMSLLPWSADGRVLWSRS